MKNKILIVDDEADVLDIYGMKFEKEGFEVYKENQSREAVKTAHDNIPDIVLLDVVMEGFDGYSVIKGLKESKKTKNIPIVLFSNLGSKENIEEGIMHGAVDYIPKANYTPKEAVKRVKKILENKKLNNSDNCDLS